MSDISIKQGPVDDARLCSVTAAELEVCIDTDSKIEQSDDDEPYIWNATSKSQLILLLTMWLMMRRNLMMYVV